VALQLGLTAAMEYGLRVLRDPYYAFKASRLRRRLGEADASGTATGAGRPELVVMVGSSRASDGLRGRLIEGDLGRRLGRPVILFNFGIPGDGPMTELLNVERLLDDGVRPDLLLVEVLPSYLTEQAVAQFDLIPAERLGLRDRAVLRRHHMPVGQLRRYSWLCWGLPWYAHRQEMMSVLLPRFLPGFLRQDGARNCDESGWIAPPYDPAPAARFHASQAALGAYGPSLQNYHLGNPFCPALRAILERCRREHIRAAVLLMPEGTAFRKLYAPGAWDQIGAFLGELSAEYGAPVIDARAWVGDGGFFDTHHLLPEGAAVFTARLAREALEPLLRGTYARPAPEDKTREPPTHPAHDHPAGF
jgi:hypothetical protein